MCAFNGVRHICIFVFCFERVHEFLCCEDLFLVGWVSSSITSWCSSSNRFEWNSRVLKRRCCLVFEGFSPRVLELDAFAARVESPPGRLLGSPFVAWSVVKGAISVLFVGVMVLWRGARIRVAVLQVAGAVSSTRATQLSWKSRPVILTAALVAASGANATRSRSPDPPTRTHVPGRHVAGRRSRISGELDRNTRRAVEARNFRAGSFRSVRPEVRRAFRWCCELSRRSGPFDAACSCVKVHSECFCDFTGVFQPLLFVLWWSRTFRSFPDWTMASGRTITVYVALLTLSLMIEMCPAQGLNFNYFPWRILLLFTQNVYHVQ